MRYSNISPKGFNVGDPLNYKVDFLANPKAEVSWTFIDWMNDKPKELEKNLIQNQRKSTMVVINRLNISYFGKYILELRNDFGKLTQEFDIRGTKVNQIGILYKFERI